MKSKPELVLKVVSEPGYGANHLLMREFLVIEMVSFSLLVLPIDS